MNILKSTSLETFSQDCFLTFYEEHFLHKIIILRTIKLYCLLLSGLRPSKFEKKEQQTGNMNYQPGLVFKDFMQEICIAFADDIALISFFDGQNIFKVQRNHHRRKRKHTYDSTDRPVVCGLDSAFFFFCVPKVLTWP